MYTKMQKNEIENVILVFKEYIQSSAYLEIVCSDKLGYILLHINPPTETLEPEPEVIKSGKALCKEIFSEIVMDVLDMTGNDHGVKDADSLEKAEIMRRIKPLIDKLPEYRDLVNSILEEA